MLLVRIATKLPRAQLNPTFPVFSSPHRNFSSTVFKMSAPLFSSYLINPTTLNTTLTRAPPTLRILCASWFLPNSPHTGPSVFAASHIPTARFFDLDAVKDNSSPYPHMLPSASDFAVAMGKLGIKKDDTVVVYDSKELGLFSAPRVAWMLRAFGHERVHILDNFRVWCNEGLPTESGEVTELGEKERVEYGTPNTIAPRNVVSFEEMAEGAKKSFEGVTVLDARPKGRWTGQDPEPRPGLSSGHMPGSMSLAFTEVLDPEKKTLLPKERLREIFAEKGISQGTPLISSCGTGVTAAVVDLALKEAGYAEENRKIYDGSWSEVS